MAVVLTFEEAARLGFVVGDASKKKKGKAAAVNLPNQPTACAECGLFHKGKSSLECFFETIWGTYGPKDWQYITQHQFMKPRRWRFDVAFLDQKLAIELDGGVHTNGGHNRGVGFTKDCFKLNAAVACGWRVLRFTTEMLKKDPLGSIELVVTCLRQYENTDPTSS